MTMRDDAGIALARGLDHPRAVDARQAQVGDDDVEGELIEQLEGLFAAVGLDDFEPALGQALGHQPAERGLVVDEEQMGARLSCRRRQYLDTSDV